MPLDSSHSYVSALSALRDDHCLDAGTVLALWLWAEPHEPLLDGIGTYEERRDNPRWNNVNERWRLGVDLMARADVLMERRSVAERGAIAHASAKWLCAEVESLAAIIAGWAIEDAIWGGALEAYRRPQLTDRRGRPHRRIMTRLHWRPFVAQYVAGRGEDMRYLRPAAACVERRVNSVPEDAVVSGLQAETSDMEECFAAESRRAIGLIMGDSGERRSVRRERRKVIKRSSAAAAALLGSETVSRFARGQEVRFRGREADILVELGGSLAGRGAHQLGVMLAEPDGRRVASLCVYVPETPALDQLVAMGLAVAAGEELEILRDANVVRVVPGLESHPLLAGKKLPSRETWIERAMTAVDRFDERRLQAGYVERMSTVYSEETWKQVMEGAREDRGGESGVRAVAEAPRRAASEGRVHAAHRLGAACRNSEPRGRETESGGA